MQTLTILEKAADSFVVPVIDNRRRSGYAMWSLVMETRYREATLVRLDGTTAKVTFSAFGWRVA